MGNYCLYLCIFVDLKLKLWFVCLFFGWYIYSFSFWKWLPFVYFPLVKSFPRLLRCFHWPSSPPGSPASLCHVKTISTLPEFLLLCDFEYVNSWPLYSIIIFYQHVYFLGSMTNSWLILLSVPSPRSNSISVKVGGEIIDKLDHLCNVSNMMSVVFLNWKQKHKVLKLLDNFDYRHPVTWRKNTVQCQRFLVVTEPQTYRKKLTKSPSLHRAQSENCALLPSCQHVTDWIERYWRQPDLTVSLEPSACTDLVLGEILTQKKPKSNAWLLHSR